MSKESFIFPDDPYATELSWSGEPPLEVLYVYFSRKSDAERRANRERLEIAENTKKQIADIQRRIDENNKLIAEILADIGA